MEANKQRDTYQKRVNLFTHKYSDIKRNLVVLSFLRFFTFILTVTLVVLLVKEFSFILLGLIIGNQLGTTTVVYFVLIYIFAQLIDDCFRDIFYNRETACGVTVKR